MITKEFIKSEYPLHYFVWHNLYNELENVLQTNQYDKEKRDARGRTPLMLAVTLGHLESTRLLLNHDANVNCENATGWTVLQEAIATGDPELLQLVLERREYQRYTTRMAGIPELLSRLNQAPDFYVEMKWEFTSWVPLVSRMCPSDTYKVYKQGSNVRVDTTLLGFDHTKWQRGRRTYIFRGNNSDQNGHVNNTTTTGEETCAVLMEIDHDTKRVYVERILHDLSFLHNSDPITRVNRDTVTHRLTTPIVTTYLDTDKISFERNKTWTGVWGGGGWRSDRNDTINGYVCKVFSASNVELVTRTRTEHLTDVEKRTSAATRTATPLHNFFGDMTTNNADVDTSINSDGATAAAPVALPHHNHNITEEEYFDPELDLNGRDIGRPKNLNTKVQKFRATLWLCEDYPLSLQEQIMPIVDLMAISSSHFAKLKDFIQMQLPSGFPVKIEIPLFHVLNARITFGNIFAMDSVETEGAASVVPGVVRVADVDTGRLTCVVDDSCFEIPSGYTLYGSGVSTNDKEGNNDGYYNNISMDEQDDLLQFAIQQSLLDNSTDYEQVDIWEALNGQKPSPSANVGEEERQLQRAIEESLTRDVINSINTSDDIELETALRLSEQQQQQDEERRQTEEQKILDEILRLSLTDK